MLGVIVLLVLWGPGLSLSQNPQCVHKGGQTESGLKELFESYGQNILALSVPRKLESHFHFADLHPRDPFLWGFVRSMEDNGHDQFFEAIKSAWFEKEVDGVLEFDCSEEQGVISSFKDSISNQLARCPESIIIFRRAHLCSVITLLADFIQDVAESSTGVPRTTAIAGNKAIFILEIVLSATRGDHLLHYLKEEHAVSDSRGSLAAVEKALALQSDIVKEYFGQWRAFSTRLWVTWVEELSQDTKFKIYQKKVRRVREGYEKKGFFINFELKQQQLHFGSLSPVGKGIVKWDYEEERKVVFFSEGDFVRVMLTCPVGESEIVWEFDPAQNLLTCNHLKIKTSFES